MVRDANLGLVMLTDYWAADILVPAKDWIIAAEIADELVGPGAWSDAWSSLLPRLCFMRRFEIGRVGHGFYEIRALSGSAFEGDRLLIPFPGLQVPWVNARVKYVSELKRIHWRQIPFIWEHDFTFDKIWEPYYVLLDQFAQLSLSSWFTASGIEFFYVCRQNDGAFSRPFEAVVDRATSRQLHRRHKR